jgi:hypothetical protein
LGKEEKLENNYYYKVAKYHGANIINQISSEPDLIANVED